MRDMGQVGAAGIEGVKGSRMGTNQARLETAGNGDGQQRGDG